jgi:deoxyribodipyrimidine photolyase
LIKNRFARALIGTRQEITDHHRIGAKGQRFGDIAGEFNASICNNRFAFFLETLKSLKSEMQERGGELLVVDQSPFKTFEMLLQKKDLLQTISWNRDYEPFSRERDQKVSDFLSSQGIEVLTERDHLLIEPWEIKPYQVFTPYAKKWFETLSSENFRQRISSFKNKVPSFQLNWSDFFKQSPVFFADALEKFCLKKKIKIRF